MGREAVSAPVAEATRIRLCAADEVAEGAVRRIDLPGLEPVAVYRVGGEIFVTDDTCSHGKASLGDEGELEGFTIICTWHDGAFDIRTGAPKALPCVHPLKTYAVSLVEGAVFITPTDDALGQRTTP